MPAGQGLDSADILPGSSSGPWQRSLPLDPFYIWPYKLSFESQNSQPPPGTLPEPQMCMGAFSGPPGQLGHPHMTPTHGFQSHFTHHSIKVSVHAQAVSGILEVNSTLSGRTQGCLTHHCVPKIPNTGLSDQLGVIICQQNIQPAHLATWALRVHSYVRHHLTPVSVKNQE